MNIPDKSFSKENEDAKKERELRDKKEHVEEAYEQAEKDIDRDPDFKPNKDEDLDEGELARKEGHP